MTTEEQIELAKTIAAKADLFSKTAFSLVAELTDALFFLNRTSTGIRSHFLMLSEESMQMQKALLAIIELCGNEPAGQIANAALKSGHLNNLFAEEKEAILVNYLQNHAFAKSTADTLLSRVRPSRMETELGELPNG